MPSDRKWADIFSECYNQLGCGLGQTLGQVPTQKIWNAMIRVVKDKVEVLDFLTHRWVHGSVSRVLLNHGALEHFEP